MAVCPICSKRVLSHALKIACHVCNETYHMKCISLTSADLDYMLTNIHNWMCIQCTSNLLPFNQIEDDNDFVLACCIQPCNELLSSDLIYNPFGSDREDIDNQNEFDPDQNFYNEQNLFNGFSCRYYLEDSFNEYWNHVPLSFHSVFHYAISIYAVLMQTSRILKTISNFYPLISLLLPSLKHGLLILLVIYIP